MFTAYSCHKRHYVILTAIKTRRLCQAWLHAARARGRKGRPKSLTPKKAQMAEALYKDKNNTIDEICKTHNVSRTTLYRVKAK